MSNSNYKSQGKQPNTNSSSHQFAVFIILFFPILGSLLYVVGSIVYWPTLSNINPYAGGTLFTIGSALLVGADISCSYIQPYFSMIRPLRNIGSLRSFGFVLGNLSFLVGSVFFLPGLPVIVGEHLFLIGSIFLFIPQTLCIWGVMSLNIFTAEFYVRMIEHRKTIILNNLSLAGGCFCYFTGTYLFENLQNETFYLNQEAVVLFVVGSLFYLLGSLIGLKMRKRRFLDPLINYHKRIYENYLPRVSQLSQLSSVSEQKAAKTNLEQYLIVPIEPSIFKEQMGINQVKSAQ